MQNPNYTIIHWSIFLIFGFIITESLAQNVTIKENWWGPNGSVNAIVEDSANNVVYLGGDFDYVGPVCPYGTVIDSATGSPEMNIPLADAPVWASCADGNGGVFIGGLFSMVGDSVRKGIAHINSLGKVTTWNAALNSSVFAITVSDSVVYIGGNFSQAGSVTRNYAAAFHVRTGTLRAWNPNANNYIRAIEIKGAKAYIGGDFTSIGGQSRNKIAALDTALGMATTWDPNANSSVRCIKATEGKVYAGGDFTSIGGQIRTCFAELDTSGGNATSLLTHTDSTRVSCFSIRNNILYLGGNFVRINGVARNYLGAINLTTGTTTPWNPNTSGSVAALLQSGSQIYVGGNFLSIGGQQRNHLASVDTSTGTVSSWNPDPTSMIQTLALLPAKLYVGGYLTSIGGVKRNGLVAIDITTGKPTAWNPGIGNGVINSMLYSKNKLYIGGTFTSVAGTTRPRAAAINTLTGSLEPWAPTPNISVSVLTIRDSLIYLGGSFTTIKGITRNRVACTDTILGNPTAWNPNANDDVIAITATENTVYLGGAFTQIGTISKNYVTAVNRTTGGNKTWAPTANSFVYAIVPVGNRIYLGGTFDQLNGLTRRSIAAVDTVNGTTTLPFNPNAGFGGKVERVVPMGASIYLLGMFNSIGGTSIRDFAVVDSITGTLQPTPDFVGTKSEMIIGRDNIYFSRGLKKTNSAYTRLSFSAVSRSSPLPVKLSFFSGLKEMQRNRLIWQTASEINNSHFVLERSDDGQYFYPLETLKAAVNSNSPKKYTTYDNTPGPLSYYRLQQVDLDGMNTISNIITIDRGVNNTTHSFFELYPNPAGSVINCRFTESHAGNATVIIRDFTGRKIREEIISETKQMFSLDIHELTKGVYFFEVTTGTDEKNILKFIKL